MKVNKDGVITIPPHIREALDIEPDTEVDFVESGGQVILINLDKRSENRFESVRGKLTGKANTDEIMQLTRGED